MPHLTAGEPLGNFFFNSLCVINRLENKRSMMRKENQREVCKRVRRRGPRVNFEVKREFISSEEEGSSKAIAKEGWWDFGILLFLIGFWR